MVLAALVACVRPEAAGPGPGPVATAESPTTGGQPTVREEPPPAFDPTRFSPEPMVSVPLLGGTLDATPTGVIAADPEGNRLVLATPDTAPVAIPLGDNARPFRLSVADDAAWVTLRGTGELARVELATGAVAWRTPVCPEPRGVAHQPDGSAFVACAGGELVEIDPNGGFVRAALLDPDLRDVVAADGRLYVSRFRAAEVLFVDPVSLAVTDVAPAGENGRVLWRLRATDDGVLALFHEVSTTALGADAAVDPAVYSGAACESLHQARIASVSSAGLAVPHAKLEGVVVPADFVVRDDGMLVVVNGGSAEGAQAGDLVQTAYWQEPTDCAGDLEIDVPGAGQPTSVAFAPGGTWAVTQGAFSLVRFTDGIATVVFAAEEADALPDDPFGVFHRDPGSGVACASCHPEGTDDANVWFFAAPLSGNAEAGPRRTLPLAGRLASRAPFHWMGELEDAHALVDSTLTQGMAGAALPVASAEALVAWLDGVRPVTRATLASEADLAAGAAAFAEAGCAACHAGEAFTDNALSAVREGESAYKTPTLLGLGLREALFHDGCATSIDARFTGPDRCTGGALHGDVGALTEEEVGFLVDYLATL